VLSSEEVSDSDCVEGVDEDEGDSEAEAADCCLGRSIGLYHVHCRIDQDEPLTFNTFYPRTRDPTGHKSPYQNGAVAVLTGVPQYFTHGHRITGSKPRHPWTM
jgi:hypothetical protein